MADIGWSIPFACLVSCVWHRGAASFAVQVALKAILLLRRGWLWGCDALVSDWLSSGDAHSRRCSEVPGGVSVCPACLMERSMFGLCMGRGSR